MSQKQKKKSSLIRPVRTKGQKRTKRKEKALPKQNLRIARLLVLFFHGRFLMRFLGFWCLNFRLIYQKKMTTNHLDVQKYFADYVVHFWLISFGKIDKRLPGHRCLWWFTWCLIGRTFSEFSRKSWPQIFLEKIMSGR